MSGKGYMNVNTDNTFTETRYRKIISVRGSVVDVRFENNLPPVYTVTALGKK